MGAATAIKEWVMDWHMVRVGLHYVNYVFVYFCAEPLLNKVMLTTGIAQGRSTVEALDLGTIICIKLIIMILGDVMVDNEIMGTITRLNVQLDDSGELSRRYLSESPYGGLVIDVNSPLTEEDLVELEVGFRHSNERYLIKAVVLWRRFNEDRLTVGVGFLPSEAEKREKLFAARQQSQFHDIDFTSTRLSNRYNAVLKVTYKTEKDFVLHFTRNLSAGGMFVSSTTPPAVDSTILFQLFPPGESDPIELPGKVVWSEPGNGFGVNFTKVGHSIKGRLENLIRHVSIGSDSEVNEPIFEQVH